MAAKYENNTVTVDNGRDESDFLKITIRPDETKTKVVMDIRSGSKSTAGEIAQAIVDGGATYPVHHDKMDANGTMDVYTVTIDGVGNKYRTQDRFLDAIKKASDAGLIDPEFKRNASREVLGAILFADKGVDKNLVAAQIDGLPLVGKHTYAAAQRQGSERDGRT